MQKILISFILFFTAAPLSPLVASAAAASAISVKLPYAKGESFVVVQGYDSPPTHINKDAYALDFSQDGCDAYGKAVVASSAGTVTLAAEDGYNGGYGTEVIVDDGGPVLTRYAHMIPDSVAVSAGDAVHQGEILGQVGDTGLVAGMACPAHPGTHVHFAMYDAEPDGTFAAHDPEPISGYTDMSAGRWYLSDNGGTEAAAAGTMEPDINSAANNSADVSGSGDDEVTDTIPAPTPQPVLPQVVPQTTSSSAVFSGGVSVSSPPPPSAPVSSTTPPAPSSTQETTSTSDMSSSSATSTGETASSSQLSLSAPSTTFNSSTLSVDIAWQAPTGAASGTVTYEIFDLTPASDTASGTPLLVGTTTATTFSYPVSAFNATDTVGVEAVDASGDTSTVATADVAIPDWQFAFQSDDSQTSKPSWYDDNWYDLGTGFYGLVRSLTFEGFVDQQDFFASHLHLQEFLDPNYTLLNQEYVISDNAPFTATDTVITVGGLAIPLRPDKYYRLTTDQDYQNRSVVLKGAATGTAMWDDFIYGTGRVDYTYPFYPYISAAMVPDYPPLLPPNPPVNIETSFDAFNEKLDVSWPAATDPDGSSTLVKYQFNYSTSTSLNDLLWQSVGSDRSTLVPVVPGNSYLLGVRTVGYSGATSTPNLQSWDFPPGYAPYIVGAWTGSIGQNFTLGGSGGALTSIDIFVDDFETTSRYADSNSCSLELFDLAGGSPALITDPDNGYNGDQCVGDLNFSFASSSPALIAGHPYQWVFTASTGNPSTQALVRLYGTEADTADGSSTDPTFANAKFTLNGASGTIFSN